MFALVDCNNFYASCERLFKPDLRNKPVVVLSNNDGCVIARSNEAKALGIKMGVPYFQIKDLVRLYDLKVFSSNYTLYGDMSNRVMTILSSFVEDMEIYSIDEAFLNLSGFEHLGLQEYGEKIVKTTSKSTGIPVSMGIAPTKTLAKVANKFAKKFKAYKGVCVIDSEEKRIKALQMTEVGDVWGIGRQHTKFLQKYNITNAYEFSQMPRAWVRANMTVVGERMWMELNGESCIELDLEVVPKKTICTSRAFEHSVTDFEDVRSAVVRYASICAEKLRSQNSCAVSLMVFIHTNAFKENSPQYSKNCVIDLPVASSSSLEIVMYAVIALQRIFREGYEYKKAGVIITEVTSNSAIQANLFDNVNREKHSRLMEAIDRINNSGFKSTSIVPASQLGSKVTLGRNLLSGCYTTNLNDVIQVNCKK